MKAGRILKLAGQNYINGLSEHHRESATKQLNVVLAAADTFNTDLAVVSGDAKLTPEGQAEASRRVAAAALATLDAVETTTIKTLTERAASLEKSLLGKVTYHPPEKTAEHLAHEMRLQEIRDQLRQLPLPERTNVYRASTDPLVLAAIETAPNTLSAPRADGSRKMEPFVDIEAMTAAKLERAEKADPATATTLRDVKSLAEMYRHAVSSVRAEILDEVPGVALLVAPIDRP